MPWYAWLMIVLAFGSILGSLFLLRDSAKPILLSDTERARIALRNAQQETQERD